MVKSFTKELGCQKLYTDYLPELRLIHGTKPLDSKKSGKNSCNVYLYKYNGQELEDELGKNTYAYQWRDYDPAIARFNKIDSFANKYDNLTPYHFSANNPIYFREIKGDSINVAQQYQQQFNQVLQSVFGNNAQSFSFNSSNNLVFNGSMKDLTKEQRQLFKDGFSDLLTEETITNVIFEDTYTVSEGNNSVTIDTDQHGGEGTLVAAENPGFSQNYVVVNPNANNVAVEQVTDAYYRFYSNQGLPTEPMTRQVVKQVNPSLSTFHGFGHIIHGNQTQEKVINFENRAIRAYNAANGTNIPLSKPDTNHNKLQN